MSPVLCQWYQSWRQQCRDCVGNYSYTFARIIIWHAKVHWKVSLLLLLLVLLFLLLLLLSVLLFLFLLLLLVVVFVVVCLFVFLMFVCFCGPVTMLIVVSFLFLYNGRCKFPLLVKRVFMSIKCTHIANNIIFIQHRINKHKRSHLV